MYRWAGLEFQNSEKSQGCHLASSGGLALPFFWVALMGEGQRKQEGWVMFQGLWLTLDLCWLCSRDLFLLMKMVVQGSIARGVVPFWVSQLLG